MESNLILPPTDIKVITPKIEIVSTLPREISNLDITAAQHYMRNVGTQDDPIFTPIAITHVNTSLFTEAARHFERFGNYPYPIPKKPEERVKWIKKFKRGLLPVDERRYWLRELKRCIHGMEAPGHLENGEIKTLHISGYYYFKLNYLPMQKLVNGYRKDNQFGDLWDFQLVRENAEDLAIALHKNFFWRKVRQIGASETGSDRICYDMYFKRGSKSLIAAYDKTYIHDVDGGGTFDKLLKKIHFVNSYTPFWQKILAKNVSDPIGISFGKRSADGDYLYSGMSAISFKNTPEAGVGKSLTRLLVEEWGTFENIDRVLDVMEPAIKTGDIQTGILVGHGTAGLKGKAQQQFIELCENPRKRNGLVFEDIFTPKDKRPYKKGCAFFYPRQKTLAPYIDENGNTMPNETWAAVNRERKEWKDSNLAKENLHNKIAQYATYMRESYSTKGNNDILPIDLISNQIDRLENDYILKGFGTHGMLKEIGENVIFVKNEGLPLEQQHEPIDESNVKDVDDKHGCITVYLQPFTIAGQVPPDLYEAVYDTIGVNKIADKVEYRNSLACILVYQKSNPYTPFTGRRLAATFLGRPELISDVDRIAQLLCKYYNLNHEGPLAADYGGNLLFENNRGETMTNFKHLDSLSYLTKTVKGGDNIESYNATQVYGITMTDQLKQRGLQGVGQMLREIVGTTDSGQPIYMVDTFYNLGMLKRWRDWSGSLTENLDSLSALILLYYLQKFSSLRDKEEAILGPSEIIQNNARYWNANNRGAPETFREASQRIQNANNRRQDMASDYGESLRHTYGRSWLKR